MSDYIAIWYVICFFIVLLFFFFFFFFNDTATTEIYTLSLHVALPIRAELDPPVKRVHDQLIEKGGRFYVCPVCRSEEHTSELQSHSDLVCRLLLEKKKKKDMWRTAVKTKKKNQPQ